MKVGEYSAYVFDLDGTLFIIPIDWVRVREDLSKLMGVPMGNVPLFQKIGETVTSAPSLKPRIFQLIDSYELRASESARPLQGAEELLYSLFETARLALVTMQGRLATEDILRRHKLMDLFETIVTREDSVDRTEQIKLALNRLAAKPGSTLFAGDRMNDLVCGRRAGVNVAIVGREMQDTKPDYSFASLAEFKAYLD
ncbi:MAG: HAD hydrolase-like protein [Nitrososphaerota archaeon]|nr:HAD hydrolase-like protein [Nitrososphaerota archaeon]